jgi:uncharacterized protein YqeY
LLESGREPGTLGAAAKRRSDRMLREAITERMKTALRAKDTRTLSTVRLIMAALKDRDIAARTDGNKAEIPDSEILRLLQGMVKQRRESMALYEQGKRPELARQEGEEIVVIESFLPQQMDDAGTTAAAKAAIADTGAAGIKDMGKVMAVLRERHAGVLDMAKAGGIVKQLLG